MAKRFVTKAVSEACVGYKNNGDEIWHTVWGVYDKVNKGFVYFKDGECFNDTNRKDMLDIANHLETLDENDYFNRYMLK